MSVGLAGLKKSELKARALKAGVTQGEIALDVALAAQTQREAAAVAAQTQFEATPRESLQLVGLRMGPLKARARSLGVTQQQIDKAEDAHDPREAIVVLAVRCSGQKETLVRNLALQEPASFVLLTGARAGRASA